MRCFLNGSFLSIRRGKTVKEPVYMALGIKPDARREALGFLALRCGRGKRLGLERGSQGPQAGRGPKGADLPHRRPSRAGGGDQEFLSRSGVSLCVLYALRDALSKMQKKNRKALA
jgi:putative transposase